MLTEVFWTFFITSIIGCLLGIALMLSGTAGNNRIR